MQFRLSILFLLCFCFIMAVCGCKGTEGPDINPVTEPVLLATLSNRYRESWLASPAVADLDEDGIMEIIVPRYNLVIAWHLDNTVVFSYDAGASRIWSSPVVADIVPANDGLEIAIAAGDSIHVVDSDGNALTGFPVTWQNELRSIAAGDLDGDDTLEIIAVTTSAFNANNQNDIIIAYNSNGTIVNNYPPNTTLSSGCDDYCYVYGGYDQNLAVGDINNDTHADIFATHDNTYLSLHHGNGNAYDASDIFDLPAKFPGIRFLHDYDSAKQGWPVDVEDENESQFTSSAPAIADIDNNGQYDLVVLGSVRNPSMSDVYRGVGLWVLHSDGSRLTDWTEPFHAASYLAGLYPPPGPNLVNATNQVTVADLFTAHNGKEMVFAGFDGRIHCVNAFKEELWTYTYTTNTNILTGGVLAVDLSADNILEIIFTTYSVDDGQGALFILDREGTELYTIPLPERGAMAVPTIADTDGNGAMEIVISLKDAVDYVRQVLVYEVPDSDDSNLAWYTGRCNFLRNGYVQ